MYSIKKYTRDRLKLLNDKLDSNSITIKVSNVKNKKIDIFINGKKTNTVGDNRYMDYYLMHEQNYFDVIYPLLYVLRIL